tara:strand:- start:2882 stop:4708 length:1827 start_codon:yes stop_codon:yes gene_type:complete
MSLEKFTDFKLPKDAYLSFDANSLKNLIIDRLNENEVFTDQNFEGSNFNAVIDVVAYMYHVLLFYLNTTSNESTLTTATIYENMNKLVSNIGYKPLGDQTSILAVDITADNILSDVYTLPKFCNINVGGVSYYSLEDITFEKVTDNSTELLQLNYNSLHQGSLKEAIFTANGEEYETITLIDTYTSSQVIKSARSVSDEKFVADNTFSIYVRNSLTGRWSEWTETASLYLENPTNKKYEKRFNSEGNYEFKFGDGNNGQTLNGNDRVVVFYLESDNESAVVGAGATSGKSFGLYTSPDFDGVLNELYTEQNLITPTTIENLSVSNKHSSTPIKAAESVEEIKQNAPGIFSTQDRLVTKADYAAQITRNFGNIAKPVKVLSNEDYTSQVLFYFNNIGVKRGIDDARTLLAQVNFSTSTNFNNIYVYAVRSNEAIIDDKIPNYLNEGQKRSIINFCNVKKDITHNVVVSDPIFKAFSFGVGEINNTSTVDSVITNSKLRVTVDRNVAINDTSIKSRVSKIIESYFKDVQLGDVIDVAAITRDILNIDGVEGLETVNGNNVTPNLSFVIWNPDYRNIDSTVLARDYKLKDFEYAYFYDISNILNKLSIRRV